MDTGDRYYKFMRGVVNDPALSAEEKTDKLKKNFFQNVKGVPEEFLEELFSLFFPADSISDKDLLEQAGLIPDLIELLYEDFDDRRDPFSISQWHEIGEVVSEFGIELDESLLNYIMSKVVERGAL